MIHKKRRIWLPVVVAAVGLLAVSCGDSGSDAATDGSGGSAPVKSASSEAIAGISHDLKGSGASFPDAFYQEAIEGLADEAPELTVTYEAVGSSSGREAFAQRLNDFAGTDSLVKEEENLAADSFFYIPSTAASIAVVFNLPSVEEVDLDGPTLAKIFDRKITRWDDPAIAATNEGADLPDLEITVARRSDGSGTTKNFTKFLESAAPGVWTLGSDDTIEWAPDTEGGQQNPGVAQIVSSTEGAIGYVDFGSASELGLSMAAVGNVEGNFVAPSIESTVAALAGAELAEDLTYDPLNGPGADAYPITAPTYLLVRSSYDDAATGKAVVAFVTWLITDGADSYATDLGYAPTPEAFRTRSLEKLAEVQMG
ncbi:MAG: phosphate ABC transporter substrate-binding protein PstS [Aquihabitans sp.]